MKKRKRLRWLVSAGPTCEDIDPVRFISNRSSGKTGYAVAEAALGRGDEAVLVTGPVAIEPPKGAEVVRVWSTEEMRAAVLARFGKSDIVVMAAAVADFKAGKRRRGKIPRMTSTREARDGRLHLDLVPTRDILAELGRRKRGQVLVGFALETGPLRAAKAKAEAKLADKNLDAIALNGPGAMGGEGTALYFLRRGGRWERWGRGTKRALASRLVRAGAEMALAR